MAGENGSNRIASGFAVACASPEISNVQFPIYCADTIHEFYVALLDRSLLPRILVAQIFTFFLMKKRKGKWFDRFSRK